MSHWGISPHPVVLTPKAAGSVCLRNLTQFAPSAPRTGQLAFEGSEGYTPEWLQSILIFIAEMLLLTKNLKKKKKRNHTLLLRSFSTLKYESSVELHLSSPLGLLRLSLTSERRALPGASQNILISQMERSRALAVGSLEPSSMPLQLWREGPGPKCGHRSGLSWHFLRQLALLC